MDKHQVFKTKMLKIYNATKDRNGRVTRVSQIIS